MKKSGLRWLHIAPPNFASGWEPRPSRLMRAFGKGIVHDVVSCGPTFERPAGTHGKNLTSFPNLDGMATPPRLNRIAKAMLGYDLVLTYGYGAMNAAMAHTAFSQAYDVPPLIHHEGEGDAEAVRGKKPDWYRRLALGRSSGLVVPSEALEEAALVAWQQPLGRVKHIAPAVDTRFYAKRPKPDSVPGLIKRPGEKWIGTCGPIEQEARPAALLGIVTELPDNWHLVVLGEGSLNANLMAQAEKAEIDHRLHFPRPGTDAAKVVGLFDIFASAALDEVMPEVALAAMASGAPIVGAGSEAWKERVPQSWEEFITPPADDEALDYALGTLAADSPLREKLSKEGKSHAVKHHDEKAMIASFRRLYSSAMRIADLP